MPLSNYPSADMIAYHANGPHAKVAVLDHEGTILSVNQAWRSSAIVHGYDIDGYGVGINYLSLCDRVEGLDADYAHQASDALRGVLAGTCGTRTLEYACAAADREHWAMFVASPLPLKWSSGAIVTHIDITPVKIGMNTHQQVDVHLQSSTGVLPPLIAYLDREHRYQLNNQAYEEWFGIPVDDLQGRTPANVIGVAAYQQIRPYIEACLTGETVRYDTSLRLKGGDDVHARITYVPEFDRHHTAKGVFAFIQDITRERSQALRVEHQAMHDALTGLPNRVLLQTCLKSLADAELGGRSLAALMILDLDDFKDINDTLGHPLGDKLLQAVAQRLTEEVTSNDTVARLGGDEFAILMIGPATGGDHHSLARRLIELIEVPFRIDEHEIHISTSIGVALFRNDLADMSQLLKYADLALYQAKSEGRGCYRIFADKMWTDLMRRQRMLKALRAALNTEQLTIRYQPQIDLKTGRMVSVEALTRWRHPTCGDIEPKFFIPIAESSGLIGKLGFWILSEASARAVAWRRAGHDFKVAINVSPAQIKQPAFLDQVRQVLATEVEPDWLEFEITEAVLIDTDRRDCRILEEIADLGIHLSIDDFGSGYSSLAYLKRLPVDKIKIDQSFIRDIGVDADDEAIIKAMIALGHQLGKDVIAEGVETKGQADFLLESGCDEAQGFYFARPLLEDQLNDWLDQSKMLPSRLSAKA